MKTKLLKLSLLISVLLLTSCASYINQMHRDLDRKTGPKRRLKKKQGTFDQFRKSNLSQLQSNKLSSNQRANLPLNVKRKYIPQAQVKRRYKAQDLTDSQNESSLWSGAGVDNSLFVNDNEKKTGDILLINVQSKLKDDITLELKRAFPDRPKKKKPGEKGPEKAPASEPATAEAPAPAAEESAGGDTATIHDRISGILIEEISKDHVLVRGRKYLLYKNRKRLIEVQALVARRDIRNDDSVHSSKILEQSITILR